MGVLAQLEPKEVFSYFETICGIPHGSGNTGPIADYLVQLRRITASSGTATRPTTLC